MPKWGIHRAKDPVNVSARFDQFPSADLEAMAEHSLMNAGAALDRWRVSGAAIDLDEAIMQTDQAIMAMRTVHGRSFV